MDEQTQKQMKEANPNFGMKFDGDKLDWSLMPFEQLEDVVKVLMIGAKKYQRDNWKFVDDAERRYFNAAMRHIIAYQNGQYYDDETKQPHLAHAICCLLFLLYKSKEE